MYFEFLFTNFFVYFIVRLLDLSFNWKAEKEDEREVVFLGGDIHCGVTSGRVKWSSLGETFTVGSPQVEFSGLPLGRHPPRGHLR